MDYDYEPIRMYGGRKAKGGVSKKRRKRARTKVVSFTTKDGVKVGPFVSNPYNKRAKGKVVGTKNVGFTTKDGRTVGFVAKKYSKKAAKEEFLATGKWPSNRKPRKRTRQKGAGICSELGSGLREVGTDLAMSAGKAAVHEAADLARRKMLALKRRFGSKINKKASTMNIPINIPLGPM